MKRKMGLGLLSAVLLISVFSAGNAYAAGCFTDFNTAAACWMKNNGIAAPYANGSYKPTAYLTRGDAANFLYKANNIPPPVGDLYVSQAVAGMWPNTMYAAGGMLHYSDGVWLKSSAVANNLYDLQLTIPTSLYGRAMRLKGVKMCYDATLSGASLYSVSLRVYNTSATGVISTVNSVIDSTARTDKTCRQYMFVTPTLLAGTHHATLQVAASFSSTSGYVGISAVTAILSPSTTLAKLSADAGPADFAAPDLFRDPGAAP